MADLARPVWRLIPSIEADGLTQMAIDDWLLDRVLAGRSPTLRFYTWTEPTLSLGFHQKAIPDRWFSLQYRDGDREPRFERPLPLVRRPTGGRAVLHGGGDRELTYAIATRKPTGKSVQRAQIYRDLCDGIVAGWKKLDLQLHYGGDRDYANRVSCFGTTTAADLVTDRGVKFIGSAQLYRKQAVLQHGSMQLDPDRQLFQAVFGEACRAIEPALIVNDRAIETLTEAVRETFGIRLERHPLDTEEWDEITARRERFQVTVKGDELYTKVERNRPAHQSPG